MAIQFLDAAEVAEAMEVSRSTAYRLIKKLNDELSGRGYLTVPGKVSKKYFAERLYGGEELMKPQVYPTDERRAARWDSLKTQNQSLIGNLSVSNVLPAVPVAKM